MMANKKTSKLTTKRKTKAVAKKTAVATKRAKKTPVKSKPRKAKTKKQEAQDVTALITQGAKVEALVKSSSRDELPGWFNVYLAVEEEPGSHTHRAKVGDIQWFLKFFQYDSGGYHCDLT